jgi:phosphoribosylanthranilate isomerase
MLVKVCGITRAEDAQLAVSLGARALGFLFWPRSPRFIDPAKARAIVRGLPPLVTPVGLFVNQTADEVNAVAAEVGLGAVQLHGDEPVEYLAGLVRPVLKAVSLEHLRDVDDANRWPREVVLLLDAHDPERRGGTGQLVDWDLAARVASRRPTLLAGGLRPENVASAIARVRPYGVDVSSGIETAPGVKDHQRMRSFFDAVAQSVHEHDPADIAGSIPHAPRS